MIIKLLPIGLVITSLVGYQLAQRLMPTDANPFTIVGIAYFLGMIACTLLASRVGKRIELADAALMTHWPIWVLAGSIVGIEVGYMLVYRVGWPLATTTGVIYTATMFLLTVISAIWFAEAMSPRRAVGLALAIGGVWLLVVQPAPSR